MADQSNQEMPAGLSVETPESPLPRPATAERLGDGAGEGLSELAGRVGGVVEVQAGVGAGGGGAGGVRTIALINQKGGVGKTTTTANLGAALADAGQRVLLIDLDPQAHLTLHFGLDPDELEHTTYDLLVDEQVSAAQVAQEVRKGLAVLPAQVNLAGAESELGGVEGAQLILRDKTRGLLGDGTLFDVALIDCPPSLGLLTISALAMASEVIVPMQAHFLALQGLSELLKTVSLVSGGLNPALRVSGVVLCMHEGHTILATEVTKDLQGFLEGARGAGLPWSGAVVLEPAIRRNIKLAESPSFGSTIFDYAPGCPGATDYRKLAKSVLGVGVGQ